MTKFNSCGCGPIVGDLHGWGDEGVQDDITLIVNNPYAAAKCMMKSPQRKIARRTQALQLSPQDQHLRWCRRWQEPDL